MGALPPDRRARRSWPACRPASDRAGDGGRDRWRSPIAVSGFFRRPGDDEPWSLGSTTWTASSGNRPCSPSWLRSGTGRLPLHFSGRSGQDAVFATADPEPSWRWFAPARARRRAVATQDRVHVLEQEHSMPDRFTVLIADFLDETSIESAVLDDIARAHHGAGQGRGGVGRVLAPGRRDPALSRHLDPGRAQLRPRAALPVRGPCRGRL